MTLVLRGKIDNIIHQSFLEEQKIFDKLLEDIKKIIEEKIDQQDYDITPDSLIIKFSAEEDYLKYSKALSKSLSLSLSRRVVFGMWGEGFRGDRIINYGIQIYREKHEIRV